MQASGSPPEFRALRDVPKTPKTKKHLRARSTISSRIRLHLLACLLTKKNEITTEGGGRGGRRWARHGGNEGRERESSCARNCPIGPLYPCTHRIEVHGTEIGDGNSLHMCTELKSVEFRLPVASVLPIPCTHGHFLQACKKWDVEFRLPVAQPYSTQMYR